LPTNPFERQRIWVEPNRQGMGTRRSAALRQPDIADWFAVASWKRATPIDASEVESRLEERQQWHVLTDIRGIGAQLVDWLTTHNQEVATVIAGPGYAKLGSRVYTVRPSVRADYDALLRDLYGNGALPRRAVHLWSVATPADGDGETDAGVAQVLDHSFYSLLALAQALGDLGGETCQIDVVSSNMQEVIAAERLCPAKATLIGPCKIIPQEFPNLATRSIDIILPATGERPDSVSIDQLASELVGGSLNDPMVALRGPHRWVETFEPVRIRAPEAPAPRLRHQGVYLISGGLGGIGLALA
jgi:acyl transferase domain-containing protein